MKPDFNGNEARYNERLGRQNKGARHGERPDEKYQGEEKAEGRMEQEKERRSGSAALHSRPNSIGVQSFQQKSMKVDNGRKGACRLRPAAMDCSGSRQPNFCKQELISRRCSFVTLV